MRAWFAATRADCWREWGCARCNPRLRSGVLDDRRDQAIVRSIAKLASDFGMHSVAEQVEDAEMAALLRDMGVDFLQGYHIHRPEALPDWQPVTVTQAAAPVQRPRAPHLALVK